MAEPDPTTTPYILRPTVRASTFLDQLTLYDESTGKVGRLTPAATKVLELALTGELSATRTGSGRADQERLAGEVASAGVLRALLDDEWIIPVPYGAVVGSANRSLFPRTEDANPGLNETRPACDPSDDSLPAAGIPPNGQVDVCATIAAGTPVIGPLCHFHSGATWIRALVAARRMVRLFRGKGSRACVRRLRTPSTMPAMVALDREVDREMHLAILRREVTTLRAWLRLLHGKGECLSDSLALAAGLRGLGHQSTVVIGMSVVEVGGRTSLHSWVECMGEPVGDLRESPHLWNPIERYSVALAPER